MKDFLLFRNKLKAVREAYKSLTDEEFAHKLHTTRQSVSNILNGTTKDPSVSFLYKLHDNLNVNSVWLVEGKGEMLKSPSQLYKEDEEKGIVADEPPEYGDFSKKIAELESELLAVYRRLTEVNIKYDELLEKHQEKSA